MASITPLFSAWVIIGVVAVLAGLMFQGSMKQQLLARKMAAEASQKKVEETPTVTPM